jgi:hypothetical protein
MESKLDTFISVCSEAYRAEDQTMDRLSSKAEKYVAAVGAIFGFHIMELHGLAFRGFGVRTALSAIVLLGMALLLIALIASLLSMRLQTYATFPDSNVLAKRLDNRDTDDQAKHAIALLYLDMRDHVRNVNEKRASTITTAGWALTLGFLLSLLGQLGLKL